MQRVNERPRCVHVRLPFAFQLCSAACLIFGQLNDPNNASRRFRTSTDDCVLVLGRPFSLTLALRSRFVVAPERAQLRTMTARTSEIRRGTAESEGSGGKEVERSEKGRGKTNH